MNLIRKHWTILLLLAITCVVIFQRSVTQTYTEIDDPKHIFENRLLNPPSFENVTEFWKKPFFGMYIPVTYSIWSAVAAVADRVNDNLLSPVPFHVLNVLLHVLNVSLVYFLLLRLLTPKHSNDEGGTRPTVIAAFAGALLFALHPLQVESVAWISGIKDILSATFALAALTFWFGKRWGWGACAFALSLMSKPGSVLLPLIFLQMAPFKVRARERNQLLAAGLLILIPFAITTMSVQAVVSDRTKVAWFLRPLVATDALGFYLGKLFWPVDLAFDYGRHPASLERGGWIYFTWVVPALVMAAAFALRKRCPWLGRGLAVATLSLFPVLGLIPFQFQVFSTVADHYFYFAMLGIAWIFAEAVRPFPKVWPAVPILIFLTVMTWRQIPVWGDNERLFQASIAVNPRSLISHTNLGYYYMMKRRPNEAVEHFRVSVELEPKTVELRVNLALSLLEAGFASQSLEHANAAVEIAPKNKNARRARGEVLRALGRKSEAERELALADQL